MKEDDFYEQILWWTESLKISKKEYVVIGCTGIVMGICLSFGLTYNTIFLLFIFPLIGCMFVLRFIVGYNETKRRVREKMVSRRK